MLADRLIKIKAWDKENKLMMRLSAVDCNRGTLFLNNFILLQFTGKFDKNETEIYEGDILLIESKKYLVIWDTERSGWSMLEELDPKIKFPLINEKLKKAVILCHYYETGETELPEEVTKSN